ncbi:hypothetical protein HPB47_004779, partial [Ixodes persulcatus]
VQTSDLPRTAGSWIDDRQAGRRGERALQRPHRRDGRGGYPGLRRRGWYTCNLQAYGPSTAPHRLHTGRRSGLERRELQRMSPDQNGKHRRAGLERHPAAALLHAVHVHSVAGGTDDRTVSNSH